MKTSVSSSGFQVPELAPLVDIFVGQSSFWPLVLVMVSCCTAVVCCESSQLQRTSICLTRSAAANVSTTGDGVPGLPLPPPAVFLYVRVTSFDTGSRTTYDVEI